MKGVVLFAIIATASGALKPGLRVKFGMGRGIGKTFMFDIPRYVDDAKNQNWRETMRPDTYLPELVLYCLVDKVVCFLYDDTGYIAGVQIALNPKEVKNYPFDWETQGFVKWNTNINNENVELYAIQQYFVDEDFLNKSKEERLSIRDPNSTLQAGGVWFRGTGGKILKTSTDGNEIKQSIFKEQACFPAMGTHYFYNITKSTECTSEQIYPWFLLVDNNKLIGTSFLSFGKLPVADGLDWFERPNNSFVKRIMPRGPECAYELANEVGVLTLHIYYVDRPWLITCS